MHVLCFMLRRCHCQILTDVVLNSKIPMFNMATKKEREKDEEQIECHIPVHGKWCAINYVILPALHTPEVRRTCILSRQ